MALKPFLTYTQQIYNLQNYKGLIIDDPIYAENVLSHISYYSLIGGYKPLFYDFVACRYNKGTNFEDLVSLYYFDEELRNLFFQYICHVEQHIRTLYAYYFSEVFSNSSKDYLNIACYNNIAVNQKQLQKLLKILSNEVLQNNSHSYVVYQRKKYNDVPLWTIMQTLTLGQVSKMYLLGRPGIKTKICRQFQSVNEKELAQHLKVLTHCRNICAHNERLYCCKLNASIPDTLLHKKLSIPMQGKQYVYGKSDLFAVLISLRYLLTKEEFKELKKRLNLLINKVIRNSPNITEEKLLNSMGFPDNWKKITLYRKL
ncbi:hypothetical protein P261_01687 [Lachnospiraceae bacterium TWA4]|nr:hypothetical protein P261_01687 [Lachnospiraceae bacterium TWA4]